MLQSILERAIQIPVGENKNGSVEHSVYDDMHERIHAYQFRIQSEALVHYN